MGLGRWARDARLSLALLGPLGGLRSVPSAPALTVRDLWTGDEAGGELMVRGHASHRGVTRPLSHGRWTAPDWPDEFRDWLQSFTWLRDLRELGTDSARSKARAMVATWLGQPIGETPLQNPAVTGARVAAWLSHYDFYAASADEDFRKNLMIRVVLEARTVMALAPGDRRDWSAFQALKGLLAAAIALPEQSGFLARYMKLIDTELEQQALSDGCHASRSPETQLLVLQELAEMRVMLQSARIPIPTTMAATLDRMTPVLRAFRHGDGRLALFNGTRPHPASRIDSIIARALPRGHVVARGLPEGRLVRLSAGDTLLFVDGGSPAQHGFDALAHAGALSFELSSGRSQLIVNCGASTLPGWSEALRETAAHSVLSLPSTPALRWGRDGRLESRPKVACDHAMLDADHLLELSSDAYVHAGAGVYRRRLYLTQDGGDLRGEDRLDGEGSASEFVLRFHLHPGVRVELEETDILLLTETETWRFRSDGYSSIEESVYLGDRTPAKTLQIVVRPAKIEAAPNIETPVAAEPHEEGAPPVEHAETTGHPDATDHEPYGDHAEASVADNYDAEAWPQETVEALETPPAELHDPNVASGEWAEDQSPNGVDKLTTTPEEPPPPETRPVEQARGVRWAFSRLDG
ncbi:heparinase II/III family protein [Acetobacter sacchari]|uniref:Heparinase II/III family protein n=1 Tax=Acetobacter sacchari TaxID=2661687 RepID=A0ABS3M135_9PROT|nr:heparinase II/III family protein [Acetobacter sacchari]MBO1361859.1 heparinase II/III family protein [Acetobacter sacchari]